MPGAMRFKTRAGQQEVRFPEARAFAHPCGCSRPFSRRAPGWHPKPAPQRLVFRAHRPRKIPPRRLPQIQKIYKKQKCKRGGDLLNQFIIFCFIFSNTTFDTVRGGHPKDDGAGFTGQHTRFLYFPGCSLKTRQKPRVCRHA